MEYSIDGLEEPLWPVFRFPTRRDAMDFLRRACSDYATAEGDQQPHVFLKRSKLAMAQQVPKLWLVGAVWLFAHPNSLVRNINSGMTLAGVSKNPDSDIEVNDEEFQLIADELLYNVASGNEP